VQAASIEPASATGTTNIVRRIPRIRTSVRPSYRARSTAEGATPFVRAWTERKTATFRALSDTTEPFAFEDVELLLDMGLPVSRVPVRTFRLDEKLELPVMEGAGWIARTKATRPDGSSASIGLRPFQPGDDLALTFYAPPTAERNDGSTLFAKSAQSRFVFEHVLVPTGWAGGPTIPVFGARPEGKVPDLAALVAAPARGEYRWTVRTFPDFDFVESMSLLANRIYWSFSTSAPRTIVLP